MNANASIRIKAERDRWARREYSALGPAVAPNRFADC